MYALITDQLANTTKTNSPKKLTRSVCFNHWSNKECTPDQLSKIGGTECLIYSLVR